MKYRIRQAVFFIVILLAIAGIISIFNKPTVSNNEQTSNETIFDGSTSDGSTSESDITITINGVDKGEYGKNFVFLNANKNSTKFLGYEIPAGKYRVKNIGNETNSFYISSNETRKIDGIETPIRTKANSDIEAGNVVDVNIQEDEYIKLGKAKEDEGFRFQRIGEAEKEETYQPPSPPTQSEKYDEVSYDSLARYPDDYYGQKIKIKGKVLQVIRGLDCMSYRVAMNDDYKTVVLVQWDNEYMKAFKKTFSNQDGNILEDDYVIVAGVYFGMTEYTTVLGATKEIPLIVAHGIAIK